MALAPKIILEQTTCTWAWRYSTLVFLYPAAGETQVEIKLVDLMRNLLNIG